MMNISGMQNMMQSIQKVGNMAQLMQQAPALIQQMQQQGITDPKSYAMNMIQQGVFSQQQLNMVQQIARQNGIQF